MSNLPLLSDEGILARRPPRNVVTAERPYAHLVEPERAADGRVVDVATLFLTNRECPYRCLMCDLWKNTLTESVAPGQIPEQIRWALARLPAAQHLKLYNAGSFFDAKAIPPEDDAEVARLVSPFERVIVECHPKLVGRRCFAFREMLGSVELEVAMGLETVNPDVLKALNKGMTTDDFARAADALRRNGVAVRAFILVGLPFCTAAESHAWAMHSLRFAFEHGVECCCLIPTRGGNGTIEELTRRGVFAPPSLVALEQVMEYGLNLRRGRVFVDLWDIDKMTANEPNRDARVARLARMNLSQTVEAAA